MPGGELPMARTMARLRSHRPAAVGRRGSKTLDIVGAAGRPVMLRPADLSLERLVTRGEGEVDVGVGAVRRGRRAVSC